MFIYELRVRNWGEPLDEMCNMHLLRTQPIHFLMLICCCCCSHFQMVAYLHLNIILLLAVFCFVCLYLKMKTLVVVAFTESICNFRLLIVLWFEICCFVISTIWMRNRRQWWRRWRRWRRWTRLLGWPFILL